ncbi:MAG: 3-hydroxyacyl-ACP dehydratase FabZ [Thermodesulfobacteriota bacterium]|nr:3-hydroxyacyl-ACP dehydratase FabZ [Thermodesulfobacteriota bacterium]
MLDIKDIMGILPHRFPFLLIDRIVEVEPGKRVVGIKNITVSEPFFQGHFPDYPIMPGVLLIEAMAQTGGVLALSSEPEKVEDKNFYFSTIDKVKFRKPVVPGDQVRFEVEVIKQRSSLWRFKGKAFVGESLVAEGELQGIISDK